MSSHLAPDRSQENALQRPTSTGELFRAFTGLALQAFGGVLAVAQHVLCDRKRWLTRARFLELLSLGQVLPGPNVCNLSLMVGDGFMGWRGALASLAGLLALPLVIVLLLAELHARVSFLPQAAGALRGMGAVSAGLIVGTALKLGGSLRTNPMGLSACVVLAAVTFVLVALLRWPLAWAVLVVGAIGWAMAFRSLGTRHP